MSAYKKKGFSIGIGIFLIMMFSPAPSGLSEVGWDVAAVAVLMAIWWALKQFPLHYRFTSSSTFSHYRRHFI